MTLLLTDDMPTLEYLSRQSLNPGIGGEFLQLFWEAVWETRAQDWKLPWARRLAWQVLLQMPYRDDANLRLFQRVLHRERDWYVLHGLALWVPSGREQQKKLGEIWQGHLDSRYPVLRLTAREALMNLGLNSTVTR